MLDKCGLDDDTPPVAKVTYKPNDIEVGCIVKSVKPSRGQGSTDTRFKVVGLENGAVRVRRQQPKERGQPWRDEPGAPEETVPARELARVHEYCCHAKPPKTVGRSCTCSLQRKWAVWGATIWQVQKVQQQLVPDDQLNGYFDVLVVDEASQMPLENIVPPASVLRRKPRPGASTGPARPGDLPEMRTGRLLVVGDPKQMGTILKCEYPPDAELVKDSPPPHLPLLTWLRDRVPSACVQLKENHRMTANLAAFTRECLGYEKYRECFHEDESRCCPCHKATRGVPRLRLTRRPTVCPPAQQLFTQIDPLVAASLDPAASLVLVVVHGLDAQPPQAALECEARLVDQLLCRYREWRDDPADEPNAFVVTPHHEQRHAVWRAIMARDAGAGAAPPATAAADKVNTVEKMQGQEQDLVLVCYCGLGGIDKAAELNFVYNRERLNTAVAQHCHTSPPHAALCALAYGDASHTGCLGRAGVARQEEVRAPLLGGGAQPDACSLRDARTAGRLRAAARNQHVLQGAQEWQPPARPQPRQ